MVIIREIFFLYLAFIQGEIPYFLFESRIYNKGKSSQNMYLFLNAV